MLSRALVLSEAVSILFPFREIWHYFTFCGEADRVWEWPISSSKRPSICTGSFPPKEPGRCLGIPLSIVQKKALNPKTVSSEVVQNFLMEIAYVKREAAARTQAGPSSPALGNLELWLFHSRRRAVCALKCCKHLAGRLAPMRSSNSPHRSLGNHNARTTRTPVWPAPRYAEKDT